MINVICGSCGTSLNIDSQLIGNAVRCPSCSGTIHLMKRTPKPTIIARFLTWPVICLAIPTILLGLPVFLGGIVAVGLFLFAAWAITNIGGAIWCKLDGTSHYLKMWKAGGGDPFFDTLDSPLNNDPPSVRFQELYRAKQRQETVAVNQQFGLPDDFMTGKSAPSSVSEVPGINDPNII
ncbi:MAG: hypothetical protein LLF97_05840 [Planctomycetaceae bacterium]|nr:hypothetical protein [Planctomycetaceae bacterium]